MVARKMVDLSLLENIGTEHRRRSGLPCHRMAPKSVEKDTIRMSGGCTALAES